MKEPAKEEVKPAVVKAEVPEVRVTHKVRGLNPYPECVGVWPDYTQIETEVGWCVCVVSLALPDQSRMYQYRQTRETCY